MSEDHLPPADGGSVEDTLDLAVVQFKDHVGNVYTIEQVYIIEDGGPKFFAYGTPGAGLIEVKPIGVDADKVYGAMRDLIDDKE